MHTSLPRLEQPELAATAAAPSADNSEEVRASRIFAVHASTWSVGEKGLILCTGSSATVLRGARSGSNGTGCAAASRAAAADAIPVRLARVPAGPQAAGYDVERTNLLTISD